MKIIKKSKLIAVLALCGIVFIGLALTTFNQKTASAQTYTKVEFTSVEKDWTDDSWSPNGPVRNLIDGDKTTKVHMPWGYTDGFQMDNSMIASFGAVKTVDKFVIWLPSGTKHTSAWRIETSEDKTNWRILSNVISCNQETTKVVNGVIMATNQNIATNALEITCDAVACKYVRLTALKKEGDTAGELPRYAFGYCAELEAFTSGATAKFSKPCNELTYTAEVGKNELEQTQIYAGETIDLYDNTKVWPVIIEGEAKPEQSIPALYIWDTTYIEFTLSGLTTLSAMRIYPYAYEVSRHEEVISGQTVKTEDYKMSDGTAINTDDGTVKEGAFSVIYFPSAFDVYAKANAGDSYVKIGSYTSVPNDVYAQDFTFNEQYKWTEFKYLKLQIVTPRGTTEAPLSAFTEIDIFGAPLSSKPEKKLVAATTNKVCKKGSNLNVNLTYTDENGIQTHINTESVGVSHNYDKNLLGEQIVTVSYQGVSVQIAVTVTESAGNECIINFVSNGGSEVDSITATVGEIPTAPTAPTKEGYVFLCWCTDQQLEYEFYFNLPFDLEDEEITLYAKWRAKSEVIESDDVEEESGCFAKMENSLFGIIPLLIGGFMAIRLARKKEK